LLAFGLAGQPDEPDPDHAGVGIWRSGRLGRTHRFHRSLSEEPMPSLTPYAKLAVVALFAAAGLGISSARAVETLTVYTYEGFPADYGPGPAIKAAFEADCACTLNWVTAGDGVALLNRLKLEGANSGADVVLGLDTNLTAEARATGLFETHGVAPAGLAIPTPWTDDLFLPYDYAHFAVVYDSTKISAPPKSLAELVDGPAAEKIVLEDPRSSTPGLGFLLWMKSVYGDKAPAAWAKLKSRVLTVAPGWPEAYALFTKGEAPMVLSYTTSPAYHVVAEKVERYKAASFSEGHYLQIEVAGLTRSSQHKDLAKKFLAFMLTPKFQDAIPTGNWMMPAAATSAALPDAFGALVKPSKTFLYTPEEVAKNRKAWIEEWQAALGQ
jgi:thiamine transport system substrate-binding protein